MKQLANVAAGFTIVAVLFGAFMYVDNEYAHADDLEEFEKKVTRSFEESRLDGLYARLEDAEYYLAGEPDDPRKRKRVEQVKGQIDRLLGEIERSGD